MNPYKETIIQALTDYQNWFNPEYESEKEEWREIEKALNWVSENL